MRKKIAMLLAALLAAVSAFPFPPDSEFPPDGALSALSEDEEFLSYFFREMLRHAYTGESGIPFAGRYIVFEERVRSLWRVFFFEDEPLPLAVSLFPSLGEAFLHGGHAASQPPESQNAHDDVHENAQNLQSAPWQNALPPSDEDMALSYKYADGRLRLMRHDDERTSVRKSKDGSVVQVFADSGKIIRTRIDASGNVLSRERYDNVESTGEMRLRSRLLCTYAGSVLRASSQDFFEERVREENDYDSSGRIVARKKFALLDESQVLLEETQWSYDGAGRMTEERRAEFTDGAALRFRTVYAYTEVSEVPDVSYYENETLRTRTEHSSDGARAVTTYFDGGFSVRAVYEDGERVSEQVLFGGEPLP